MLVPILFNKRLRILLDVERGLTLLSNSHLDYHYKT